MRTSESIKNIAAALIRAQGKFPAIVRTKTAEIKGGDKGTYSFNYAPLEEILHTLRPTLQAEGLALIQGFDGFCLETTLLHESGEWILHSMEMPHAYPSPRAYGSELTFRRRYSVTAVLGIASEEDDDGQQAERDLKAKPKKKEGDIKISGADMKMEAFERMDAKEQEFLRRIAADVVALLTEGRADDAYGFLRAQKLDTEEQLAVQHLFSKAESKALAEAGKRFQMALNVEKRAADKAAQPMRGMNPQERTAAA